ncbi:uncharacterized protein T551_00400 [Pneumocystis jirovecii RU7]|uniref:t-SNARE coiled-coil homology domain-containing protein n=1 Tax=Pneumocystis jirovecii (strain RU7) TaxID=1408657 RepID=A0A0W4ZVA8_PNEJ7|nr:uncharacterized protein T551_00400 [Pneumocystis jirovecii RU7]KTW32309.1 hypothetical protein T551_00400 [Pneumocystis jirovecii RU7]
MVVSFSRIYEQQNDNRLEELESKISMLKDITTDIYKHASDTTMIDQGKQAITSLSQSVQASVLRLNRLLLVKTSIFKGVCFFILIFTILWMLSRYF